MECTFEPAYKKYARCILRAIYLATTQNIVSFALAGRPLRAPLPRRVLRISPPDEPPRYGLRGLPGPGFPLEGVMRQIHFAMGGTSLW